MKCAGDVAGLFVSAGNSADQSCDGRTEVRGVATRAAPGSIVFSERLSILRKPPSKRGVRRLEVETARTELDTLAPKRTTARKNH